MQPDVIIESGVEIEYDPLTATSSQPAVEIESGVEIDYTAPASTGGQPAIVIVSAAEVFLGAQVLTVDAQGECEIVYTTTGRTVVETEPVPVPVSLVFDDVEIVKVSMPRPTVFDQFGRPIG
jgi:hypothetical protein